MLTVIESLAVQLSSSLSPLFRTANKLAVDWPGACREQTLLHYAVAITLIL